MFIVQHRLALHSHDRHGRARVMGQGGGGSTGPVTPVFIVQHRLALHSHDGHGRARIMG